MQNEHPYDNHIPSPIRKAPSRFTSRLALTIAVVVIVVGGYLLLRAPRSSGLSQITSASDPVSLAGKKVSLTNVAVRRLGSDDIVFWVANKGFLGTTGTERVFVFSEFDAQSGAHIANGGVLADGQVVSIEGTVRPVPSIDQLKTIWNLSDADAKTVLDKKIYIDATDISIKK